MNIDNWIKYCNSLRNKILKKESVNKYLLANFSGTFQQKDIEHRTPLINDFFRTKINVKSFDEETMQKENKHAIDFSDNRQVFDSLAREFDMPYWGFIMGNCDELEQFHKHLEILAFGCRVSCPYLDRIKA